MKTLRRISTGVGLAALLFAIAACSTNSNPADAISSLVISPAAPQLAPGEALQFTASETPVTWSVLEADGGVIDANGVYTAPAVEGTFTVTASLSASAMHTTRVHVTRKPQAPVVSAFAASPSSVTQGSAATLSWTVTGATSISIDQGVGVVTGAQSSSVTPSNTTSYTLTATNDAGSTTASAAVTVTAPAPVPPPPDPTPTPTPTPTGANIGACTGLVSTGGAVAMSPLAKPAYLQSANDPDFGTRITRVTGAWGSAVPTTWATDGSLAGKVWRSAAGGPTYTHDDAWNADQSLLVCKKCVDGGFLYMDGATYHPLFFRGYPTRAGGEVRWHPTDPSKMLWVDGDGTVGWWNPVTNAKELRYSPSSDGMSCSGSDYGGYNGNPSWDGKRTIVMGNCPDQRFWIVDYDAGARVSPIFRTSALMARSDWPSGQTELGGGFIFPKTDGLVRVAPNWQRDYVIKYTGTGTSDWSVLYTFSTGHEDVAVDASGNDVTFNGGTPEMWDATTGGHTSLSPSIYANQYHTSGKFYRAPGWGMSSLDGVDGNLKGEIVALELKANGAIRRIAHHRTALDSAGSEPIYDHTAFPVPSNDGLRYFFNSDWGNGSAEVYGYVADVRNVCP